MKHYYYLVFKEDNEEDWYVKLTTPTKMMDRELKELVKIFQDRCLKNCNIISPPMIMNRMCHVMGSGWHWEDWTDPIVINISEKETV